MPEQFMLDIPTIAGAKICGQDCVYKNNGSNGSIEALKAAIVSCVGCGRPCHLQCHRVTGDLLESVKSQPKNNRCNINFGEASNVRLVCDNCLTWLNCEVPDDIKASFMLVFSRIAAKLITDKYADNTRSTPNSRKRRMIDSNDSINVDTISELKDMIGKCLVRIDEMDRKNDSNIQLVNNHVEKVNKNVTDVVKSEVIGLKTSVTSNCNVISIKMKANQDKVDDALSKLDKKHDSNHGEFLDSLKTNTVKIDQLVTKIEEKSGLDLTMIEGNNNNTVINSPGTVSTPTRPYRASINSTIRRRAMLNNARSFIMSDTNETPRTALSRINGPNIPTQHGTSSDNEIFGPSVPRGVNLSTNGIDVGRARPAAQFRHNDAIFIRYVDPSITVERMRDILTRNDTIKQRLEENEDNIEITRLVKKNVPEEVLANRRNGISYRIGCSSELYQIIVEPNFWAPHWEIRQWDSQFQNNRISFPDQRNRSKNDRTVNPPPPINVQASTSTGESMQTNP